MKLIQLSKHCYCSDFDRDYDRPRLGYVYSQDQALMIDAGNSPAHYHAFIKLIQDADLPTPQLLVLTHWHWDHVFGLVASDIPSICTEKTQTKLEMMQTWLWDEQSMQTRLLTGEDIAFCDEYMRKEYTDPQSIRVVTANQTFKQEQNLTLGDLNIKLKAIDNDHSEDACVVYVEPDKVLFLGDIYTENYHNGPPHYTQAKLSSLIHELKQVEFNVAIHGHDRFRYQDELIQELKQALSELEQKKD
jgi:glyoxylase-like metal-dependent hydrolase (beta-lactamase superfamily II)